MSTDLDDLTPDDLADLADLRRLMGRALDDVDVPVPRLHARATADGRQLRRRRRVVTAVGGLAAAATIAALAGSITGGSATVAHDRGFATEHTAAVDPQVPFVARPGFWDMPAVEMADRLSGLLPDRVALRSFQTTSTDHAPGESDALVGYLDGTLTAPVGEGGVNVMLTQLPARAVIDAAPSDDADGDGNGDGCPPDVSMPEVEVRSCSVLRDASGRVVEQQLETSSLGVTVREATLITHGAKIYVAAADSTGRKWATPSGASRPPLTMAQLTRIAQSDVWTSWTPPSRG